VEHQLRTADHIIMIIFAKPVVLMKRVFKDVCYHCFKIMYLFNIHT